MQYSICKGYFFPRKDFENSLNIMMILCLSTLPYHPSMSPISYLAQSSKLERSWVHAVSEPSKCRNLHHRHPPSGFGGCIPENGVSPAQPGGPETTCHAQQKWCQNGSTRLPLSSCLLRRTWQNRKVTLEPEPYLHVHSFFTWISTQQD